MTRKFLKLCVANFALLIMYLASNCFEWGKLLGLPLVAAVNWAPFRTQIWFGGTVPIIIDGLLWIEHWSLAIVIVIVAVNLAVIWKSEHKNA